MPPYASYNGSGSGEMGSPEVPAGGCRREEGGGRGDAGPGRGEAAEEEDEESVPVGGVGEDLRKFHSSLTDDEARDLRSTQSRNEKTIQTVYAQAKDHPVGDDDGTGLYEAMCKEVRHAVDEIRTELEKVPFVF
uniref:Uncharacterized protein n=1 Tax=Ananas comosus var. bracteatus TaxID=296719 RepID=A0A6V7NK38_ANACO|nr:unnamed protein product [Ananas comosus var. bracteatus]